MSKKSSTFTERIKELIDASGLARNRICVECGIDPSAMSRFMSGEREINLASLDKIAAFLEWTITTKRSK
jgi:transcriptional regulator with XRE-family HTH domain